MKCGGNTRLVAHFNQGIVLLRSGESACKGDIRRLNYSGIFSYIGLLLYVYK